LLLAGANDEGPTQTLDLNDQVSQELELERETGVETRDPQLGKRNRCVCRVSIHKPWQVLEILDQPICVQYLLEHGFAARLLHRCCKVF